MTKKMGRSLLALAALSVAAVASADDSVLTITVTGERFSTFWEVDGQQQSSVDFDFDGYTTTAGDDVDSKSRAVSLVDTKFSAGDDKSVVYSSPTGCSIVSGGQPTPVLPGDIALVNSSNGDVAQNAGPLTLKVSTPASLLLRMAGVGAVAGEVSCTGTGALTYTY